MMTSNTAPQKKITKKYRIPKKIDVVIDKLKKGKNLTKEQDKLVENIVNCEINNYKKIQKKMRGIVMLMRLQHDCLNVLEDGEILR
jgi:uncharacterized protein YbjQ (UPF0145 family)